VWVLFFVIFYLVTINTTSTKWYFLRQSMRELESVQFRHNVAAFQVAIARRQLRDKVDVNYVNQWDTRQQQQQTNIIRMELQ